MTCISVILYVAVQATKEVKIAQKVLNNEYKATGGGILFRGIYVRNRLQENVRNLCKLREFI
jgi:hypothetical protein